MLVRALTTAEELEALSPDWERLWWRSAAGLFQHPDWLLAWWRHLGGGELWTLAAWEEGGLVGLAPFYVYTHPGSGARQVTLVGNGVSDSLDAIVARSAPHAAGALAAYLHRHAAHWDLCDFRQLPAGSALLEACAGQADARPPDVPCLVLDLRGAGRRLAGIASATLLAKLRNRRRRAEALGNVRVDRATPDTLPAALEGLFSLHGSRWSARGEGGVLSEPAVVAFHCDVAARFLERGWLRLYLLRIGERLASAYYGFCLRGRAYAYIGGFDPNYLELSPGSLVIEHAVAEAMGEGAAEFDFLRGAETYKYRWGAQERPHFRLQLAADEARSASSGGARSGHPGQAG